MRYRPARHDRRHGRNRCRAYGACHATKACVSEKRPLTNRIGGHFARIKAIPARSRPITGYRGKSPVRGLERDDFSSNRHPALSFCLSMIFFGKPVSTFPDHALSRTKQAPKGSARTQVLREQGFRKRRDRKPGRSCRLPCRDRPRRERANGAPLRRRGLRRPARRCGRPSAP
jgi:hypothetical protein